MAEGGKKYRGGAHPGPHRSAPYPVSRLAPEMELVDMAREIAQADARLKAAAGARLETIVRQIRALQEEARRVLEATRRDQELHRVPCQCQRVVGRVYHLYRRPDGSRYFSLLSPEEWGGRPPHEHLGAYRLEADMHWTPAGEAAAADAAREEIQALLEGPPLPRD